MERIRCGHPVFSLRSKNSFGVGEFADLKLLVDWAKETGLKLIQILPVNDTTATNTWIDSYPYAAISAFALLLYILTWQK
ncbi:MAG: 4-alpha-glucanotransferase [Bacteroidota bacterium]